MPNRYEREIEEILRNLEHTEPKQGRVTKFGERLRRRPGIGNPVRRVDLSSITLKFSPAEWLLITAVIAALVAGGYAYTLNPGIFTGILAAIGLVCLVLVACSHFIFNRRRVHSSRYGEVKITPLRRSPLSMIKTQWNLFLLKLRYRRRHGR